jgi:cytochrome b subunit of formate dehydrogenase
MELIQFAADPWGQKVPSHIAWSVMWLSLAAGLAFLAVHAALAHFRAKSEADPAPVPPELAACVPPRAPRHTLAARIFHWLMAAAVIVLLCTAFLPRAGLRFDWLTLHWLAGSVLLLAVVFHLGHAVFSMDFWSIWPDLTDLGNLRNALVRLLGRTGVADRKPGKYPLGNKLFHLAALACGLCLAATGALLLVRVRTPFFTRDPYLLGDQAWGLVYLLHGFAGAALIALTIIHIYFALRPEKLPVTVAMIRGSMDRAYVLGHHDPSRWGCDGNGAK